MGRPPLHNNGRRSRRRSNRPRDSESASSNESVEEQKALEPKKTNIELKTEYKKEDIDFCEYMPDNRE